jgi:hypothetical protein
MAAQVGHRHALSKELGFHGEHAMATKVQMRLLRTTEVAPGS